MNKRGEKLLFGNEAVVQGALEAGMAFSSSYPGTPASEIADTLAKIADQEKIYFEYSTNEKVALEVAGGAAMSGLKVMVSMKHYGLNVAIDSLLPLVYLECPLVVVVSDDPGSWSSIQAEQDSRWYSRMGLIPTFEPSDSQEAKEMTKEAFRLAWDKKIPVIVRLTTRVALSRSKVSIGELPKKVKVEGKFDKPEDGFKLSSQQTKELHQKTIDKIEKIRDESGGRNQFNLIINGEGKKGIICSGISYQYCQEALKKLNLHIPVLKVGMSYPIGSNLLNWFVQNLDEVLIVEELEPIIEEEVRKIKANGLVINGKDKFCRVGEYRPEQVIKAVAELTNQEYSIPSKTDIEAPTRVPYFCPGCPHRGTFYALEQALGKEPTYLGDIGCYMMGTYPPYQMVDLVSAMGAGSGISQGISQASQKKTVALIGDSTFFHAGIPALINAVYNQHDILLIILDNRYTAMTGQQPNPGTGERATGKETEAIKIEKIVEALGVDQFEVGNAYNIKQTTDQIKELYSKPGVSVLVSKGECRVTLWRRMRKAGKEFPKFQFQKEVKQDKKIDQLGCPAIVQYKSGYKVDQHLCTGCSYCQQLLPDSVKAKGNDERK